MKKLAVLGASYLQKPLVDKAREMGIETHCFAWDNAEAICKDIADYFYPVSVLEKEAILEHCRKIGIDGITTIATDICIPTIAYVAQQLGLVSNTQQSAYLSTNKAAMRQAFAVAGVASPQSITVTQWGDLAHIAMEYPLIVKPTDRSGSRGVTKALNQQQLVEAINRATAESLEKKAVVETFIEGAEVSVESISFEGKHYILAITDKVTTGEPYFVELQHHQPSLLPDAICQEIIRQTCKALDAVGVSCGAGHSEFKIDPSGKVYAIEVGARMGGDFIGSHMVPLSTGYDFLKGVIGVALNEFDIPQLSLQKSSGVYFLCAQTAALQPYFENPNPFDIAKAILKGQLIPVTNSNDRSGFLVYQSDHKVALT